MGSEIGGKKSCANIMAGSKAKMAGRRFSDVVAKTMVAKMAGTYPIPMPVIVSGGGELLV